MTIKALRKNYPETRRTQSNAVAGVPYAFHYVINGIRLEIRIEEIRLPLCGGEQFVIFEQSRDDIRRWEQSGTHIWIKNNARAAVDPAFLYIILEIIGINIVICTKFAFIYFLMSFELTEL